MTVINLIVDVVYR